MYDVAGYQTDDGKNTPATFDDRYKTFWLAEALSVSANAGDRMSQVMFSPRPSASVNSMSTGGAFNHRCHDVDPSFLDIPHHPVGEE